MLLKVVFYLFTQKARVYLTYFPRKFRFSHKDSTDAKSSKIAVLLHWNSMKDGEFLCIVSD